MTTDGEYRELAKILTQKAKGERNRLGDLWGDHYCSEAASAILALLEERDKALKLAHACTDRGLRVESRLGKAKEALRDLTTNPYIGHCAYIHSGVDAAVGRARSVLSDLEKSE